VRISDLSGVTDVSSGCAHSLAVKKDGTVWAWGSNYYGQLGDGTTTNRYTPVKVSGLSGIKDVAGGCYHSLAVKEDGTVWAWGYNYSGELGDGTTTDRTTPVKVSDLSGVTDVAGGFQHSLAVKDDGTVWTWGRPDCCTPDRTIPLQVGGLSGITYAVGGMAYNTFSNLAISSDIPAPTITSPQNNTYDKDGSFNVSGSAQAGSTVELFEGTTSKGTTKADSSSGAWSIALSGASEGAHTYTAKATDAAGNTSSVSNSVTVKVDKISPKVVDGSVIPKDGATGVDRTTDVKATFSEDMDASSINGTTFKLFKQGSTTKISATVSYDPNTRIVTLNPFGLTTTRLARGTTYKAVVTTGATDMAGNQFDQNLTLDGLQQQTWFFTTTT